MGGAAALLIILLLGAFLAVSLGWGGRYGWGMMGPGMMGGWSGFSIVGPVFGMILMGLIIGGVVWLMQTQRSGEAQSWSGRSAVESPLEIAKWRYAQGEITKEQFEDMKRDLES